MEGNEDNKPKETVRFEEHTAEEARQFLSGRPPKAAAPEPPAAPPGTPAAEPPAGNPPVEGVKPEDVVAYQAKITELETQLNELKTTGTLPTIKNPLYYKLQMIEEQSPEEAPMYRDLLLGKPSDEQIWKWGLLKDHPTLKDETESVNRKFERTYPGLFNGDPQSVEYKDAKLELKLDAEKVRKSLMEKPEKIQMPDPKYSENAAKAELATLTESWKPEFTNLVKGFTKFSSDVTLGDKTVHKVEIEIPESERRTYLEQGAAFALANKLAPGEESVKKVNQFMTNQYVAKNIQHILTSAMQKAADERETLVMKKFSNVKGPIESPNTPAGKVASNQEEFVNSLVGK